MKTKQLVLTAILIATSFLGAYINFPGTTIALDSMPAFFAALMINPFIGLVVGVFGHFFTALLRGFPMSLPVHLMIMLGMAITMLAFGYTYKMLKATQKIKLAVATVVGVLFNAPVSLLLVSFIIGWGIFAMLPILLMGAFVNIFIAIILFQLLKGRVKID
ncbi:MAG: ECF transporter S component [Alkaliphilus sp.]|nr:ECF transporter S component [bacterium AH-315-E09]PHS30322.1 MAG: ECF transporter S component [Alkaliphilus sp.]